MPPGYSLPPKKVSHSDLEANRAARTLKIVSISAASLAALALCAVGSVKLVRHLRARWSQEPLSRDSPVTPVTPVIPPSEPSPLPIAPGEPVQPEGARERHVCVTIDPSDEPEGPPDPPEEEAGPPEKPRLQPTEPIYRVQRDQVRLDSFDQPLVPPAGPVSGIVPLEPAEPRSLFADMPIGVLCGQAQDPKQGALAEQGGGCAPEDGPRMKFLGPCGEQYLFLFTNGYGRTLIAALVDPEGQQTWDIQLPPNSTTFIRSRWPLDRAYLRVSAKP